MGVFQMFAPHGGAGVPSAPSDLGKSLCARRSRRNDDRSSAYFGKQAATARFRSNSADIV
jgi:hypothetical protein